MRWNGRYFYLDYSEAGVQIVPTSGHPCELRLAVVYDGKLGADASDALKESLRSCAYSLAGASMPSTMQLGLSSLK